MVIMPNSAYGRRSRSNKYLQMGSTDMQVTMPGVIVTHMPQKKSATQV